MVLIHYICFYHISLIDIKDPPVFNKSSYIGKRMSKLSAVGLISLVTGLAMLIFKSISALTSVKLAFPDLTIEDVVSPGKLGWVDAMAEGLMHNLAVGVISIPLYIYCIGLGIILLIASGLLSK